MSTVRTRSWLLLLYALPSRCKAERVSLWRKLKKFGAVQKTSAYILPDEPAHRERFQWLAKQVLDSGGEATLVQAQKIEGLPDEQIINLFHVERANDYKGLIVEAQALAKKTKRAVPEFEAEVERLRRRFQELRAIDYFDCPSGHDAEMLLNRVATRFKKSTDAKTHPLNKADYTGRTWLTRPRPEIDRVGSAWLIKKFIDPEARFVFALRPGDSPNAIPYDMPDVEFTHQGEDCTFETLLKRFHFSNPRLQMIGEMIHDADLEDGKFGRTECMGIDLVLKGFATQALADEEILTKGFSMFDGLYSALR
jgi:hypothetical protein